MKDVAHSALHIVGYAALFTVLIRALERVF